MKQAALGCFLLFASCSSQTGGRAPAPRYEAGQALGSQAVILPASSGEQVRWLGHPGAQSYWQPSSSDVERIHGCLRSELEAGLADPARLDYRQEQLDSRLRWLQGELRIVLGQLERYRQQFVGLTLADGSRQILVRCFPGEQMQPAFDFPNWRRELVVVCDGGADYWYAVFDAESGRLLLFSSNGYA